VPEIPLADQAKNENGLQRRWFLLLPVVFVTYSLAYLGRSNFGFGAAAGLAKTLHITDARVAFLSSAFFLGYLFFQIPAATYATRKSATRLVFFALIGWGTFSALTGVIRQFWLLVADRLLLGVSESLIFPSMLILLTHWFTRAERSRANAVLILGNPVTVTWMAAVTGYLINAVGWQWTFILEGIPSIVWAVIWALVARDQPHQARWMSEESGAQLEAELQREQAGLPHCPSFAATLRMPGVLLLSAQYFFWSFSMYALTLWIPAMIRSGSQRGIGEVGLLSAPPFLLGVILMLVVAHFSDRALNRKAFVWPFLAFAGIGLLCSYAVGGSHFWLGYACLVAGGGAIFAPYGPFFAIVPEMLPSTVAGEVMALVNSGGALGGFAGTWLIGALQAITGSPHAGFLSMAIALLISSGITLCLRAAAKPAPARA